MLGLGTPSMQTQGITQAVKSADEPPIDVPIEQALQAINTMAPADFIS